MALSVPATKTAVANYLETQFTYGAIFTTAPSGATPGTEVTGGSPAYARKPLTWTNGADGVTVATATFDIPVCSVFGTGLFDAVTAGNYKEGRTETEIVYAAQGQLTVTWTTTAV